MRRASRSRSTTVDRPGERRREARLEADRDRRREPATVGRVQLRQPGCARSASSSAGRSAYATVPGHSLGPVSRWPETARSVTSLPALELERSRPRCRGPSTADRCARRRDATRAAARVRPAAPASESAEEKLPIERDSDRAGVESLRVGADHVPVDPAAAALVDRAEAVDEEVVADVVPAVALDVVDLDAAHDCRCLRARVGVRAGRVMDDGEPQHRRDHGRRADDLLVRIPRRARLTIAGSPAEATARVGADSTRDHSSYDAQAPDVARRRGTAPPTTRRSSRGCRRATIPVACCRRPRRASRRQRPCSVRVR